MENITRREIKIPVEEKAINLIANLTVPEGTESIVIFSHGSGSSRFSPRNNYVANVLNKRKIATLLIDLLSPQEDAVYENRFDIDLLTTRLVAVTEYVLKSTEFKNLHIGYFGASTGAASALDAAARLNDVIEAVVSRGGRPDLAETGLPLVKASTLLIIGGLDVEVIEMNRKAYRQLNCEKKMVIVEGATHLFEEEGKLEDVSELAAVWFENHLVSGKFQQAENKIHAK